MHKRFLMAGLMLAGVLLSFVAAHAIIGKSDFRIHADRIAEIRQGGWEKEGVHMIYAPVKISADDYFLMGCDNSSAQRDHPELSPEEREESFWFAGGDDLTSSKINSGNYEATKNSDGSWHVDSFYTTLPKPEYQASPEEVAWHYVRVR